MREMICRTEPKARMGESLKGEAKPLQGLEADRPRGGKPKGKGKTWEKGNAWEEGKGFGKTQQQTMLRGTVPTPQAGITMSQQQQQQQVPVHQQHAFGMMPQAAQAGGGHQQLPASTPTLNFMAGRQPLLGQQQRLGRDRGRGWGGDLQDGTDGKDGRTPKGRGKAPTGSGGRQTTRGGKSTGNGKTWEKGKGYGKTQQLTVLHRTASTPQAGMAMSQHQGPVHQQHAYGMMSQAAQAGGGHQQPPTSSATQSFMAGRQPLLGQQQLLGRGRGSGRGGQAAFRAAHSRH